MARQTELTTRIMENTNNKPKPRNGLTAAHRFGFMLGLLLAAIIAFGVLVPMQI